MIEQQHVGSGGEADRGEPQCVQPGEPKLFARDRQLAEHRDDRAVPERVRARVLQPRPQEEDRPGRDRHAREVEAPVRPRRAQTGHEQHDHDHGDGPDRVREQRRERERRQQRSRGNSAHGATS
jgi:hypothetical protein